MKKLLVVLSLGFLAAGCSGASSAPSASTNPPASVAGTSTSSGTKLTDEPYANFAYEVDPNNMSSLAKQATTGFDISAQTLANGDSKVTMHASNPEYHDQTYELKPGQKLYFIEKNLGDDKDGEDKFLGDDTAVVVDSNGYVVTQ